MVPSDLVILALIVLLLINLILPDGGTEVPKDPSDLLGVTIQMEGGVEVIDAQAEGCEVGAYKSDELHGSYTHVDRTRDPSDLRLKDDAHHLNSSLQIEEGRTEVIDAQVEGSDVRLVGTYKNDALHVSCTLGWGCAF